MVCSLVFIFVVGVAFDVSVVAFEVFRTFGVASGLGIQVWVQWPKTSDPLHICSFECIFSRLRRVSFLTQTFLARIVILNSVCLVRRPLHQTGHCVIRDARRILIKSVTMFDGKHRLPGTELRPYAFVPKSWHTT